MNSLRLTLAAVAAVVFTGALLAAARGVTALSSAHSSYEGNVSVATYVPSGVVETRNCCSSASAAGDLATDEAGMMMLIR